MFKSQDEGESQTQFRVSLSESDGGFSRKAGDRLFSIVRSYDMEEEFKLTPRNHSGNDELTRGGVNEAIAAVRSWDSDLAFVPYFNSVSGLHEATARELVKGDLVIVAEVKIKIEHALVTSRRAFRKVIEEKVGSNDPDVQKFINGGLGEDGARRLSSMFVNWMIDLYGHPKSFEQCEPSLASEGLPRREHHRLQSDPVRMVLRISELLDSAATRGGGNWNGSEPGNTAIFLPLSAQKGTEMALEDLYTTATRGLLPIPSPFMAALAPKGSFPRLDEKATDRQLEERYPFTADHLRREMIEIMPPNLPTLDPNGNATRFLLIAHANNKPVLKHVMRLKKKLWGCSGNECSVFESTATKKVAFAAQLSDKGKWSSFHERVKRRIGELSFHSQLPTLLPPEILEHPGGKSMIMEGIYPRREMVERMSNAAGVIKGLDSRGGMIAKEAKDAGGAAKAVPSATFLGAYVAFDELKDEHKAAESRGGIVATSVSRALGRALIALLLALVAVAASAWAVQDVSCKTSAELSSVPCQYRTFTDPIYRQVAPTVEGWLSQFKGWTWSVGGAAAPGPAKAVRQATEQNSCPVGETARPASAIASASGLACPSECSDKCVLEKREGSKTRTRCFRAPSCPAT